GDADHVGRQRLDLVYIGAGFGNDADLDVVTAHGRRDGAEVGDGCDDLDLRSGADGRREHDENGEAAERSDHASGLHVEYSSWLELVGLVRAHGIENAKGD